MEFLTRWLCCTSKWSCESRSCDHISTYQTRKERKNVDQVPRSVTHGKCSTHNWQCSPSSTPVNAWGSASLCICAGLHSCAKLALSFAPQCSPHVGLFSSCTSASVGHTSLHCCHHTPPLHLPASAMRPLASPPLPPPWPPTPRHHAVMDAT